VAGAGLPSIKRRVWFSRQAIVELCANKVSFVLVSGKFRPRSVGRCASTIRNGLIDSGLALYVILICVLLRLEG
jgi:hypothetical protein